MRNAFCLTLLTVVSLSSVATECMSTISPTDTIARVKDSMQCWKASVESLDRELRARKSEVARLSQELRTTQAAFGSAKKQLDATEGLAAQRGGEIDRMRAEARKDIAPLASGRSIGAPWHVLTHLTSFGSIDTCMQAGTKLLSELPEMKPRSKTNQYLSFADDANSISIYCLSNSTLVFATGPSFEKVRELSQGVGKKLDSSR